MNTSGTPTAAPTPETTEPMISSAPGVWSVVTVASSSAGTAGVGALVADPSAGLEARLQPDCPRPARFTSGSW
jgi:hypothetical protein